MNDATLSNGIAANQYFFENSHWFFFSESSLLQNIVSNSCPFAKLSNYIAKIVEFDDVKEFNNVLTIDRSEGIFLILE